MSRRRGSVILAVMVVMAVALLIVVGMLSVVRGEVAAASTAPRTTQSRALAWSGLQAIGTSLDRQRDRILDGAAPTLRRQIVLVDDDRRLGVVRLLEFGSDGQTLVAEAGKIDLNSVDLESLAATGLVDEALARRIIEHRDRLGGGRFRSEIDLLAVPGVNATLLYGTLDRLVLDPRVGVPRGAGREQRGVTVQGLLDAVTVHGIEPALQRSGVRRINLNRPWSSELGERVDERFGGGASTALRQLMQAGTTFDRENRIAEVLAQFNVPPTEWNDILDAFTTESGDLHGGRLDLNTASAEALLSLPGLTPPQAAQIVREREALSEDELAARTWPLLRDILTPEQFGAIAHRVTTRSWTWRFRMAAGEVDAEDPDGPLLNPVVWEVVIDLTAPAWRIAYLRESTLLPLAAAWSADSDDEKDDLDADDDDWIGDGTEENGADGAADDDPLTTPQATTATVESRRATPTPRPDGSTPPAEGPGAPAPAPASPPQGVGVGRHRM